MLSILQHNYSHFYSNIILFNSIIVLLIPFLLYSITVKFCLELNSLLHCKLRCFSLLLGWVVAANYTFFFFLMGSQSGDFVGIWCLNQVLKGGYLRLLERWDRWSCEFTHFHTLIYHCRWFDIGRSVIYGWFYAV